MPGKESVKIILWVLSMHLDRQMDEALAQYEEWGAAGIKVDFMDSDDQDMVNWYQKLARKAASTSPGHRFSWGIQTHRGVQNPSQLYYQGRSAGQ